MGGHGPLTAVYLQVFDDVKLGVRLGHGSNGTVYLGIWHGQQVAVKACPATVARLADPASRCTSHSLGDQSGPLCTWQCGRLQAPSASGLPAGWILSPPKPRSLPQKRTGSAPFPAAASPQPLLCCCAIVAARLPGLKLCLQVLELSVSKDEKPLDEEPAEVRLALNVDHPNLVRLLQHDCRLSRHTLGQVLLNPTCMCLLPGLEHRAPEKTASIGALIAWV